MLYYIALHYVILHYIIVYYVTLLHYVSHSSYVNEKKWRRCYSEKFTILLTIFKQSSWK
jgi:hypothetical protein